MQIKIIFESGKKNSEPKEEGTWTWRDFPVTLMAFTLKNFQ